MTIETYGTGERLRIAAALSRELMPKHLVLLPVPTTKDNLYVAGTEIPLSDTLSSVGSDSAVVGYALPQEYINAVRGRGGRCLDLAKDEAFLCDNAEITAEAALGYLLSTVVAAPRDMRFGIFGYGRIGSRLARQLLFLGARVRVYTSREPTAIELGSCGLETVKICEEQGSYSFDGIDILINTAPKDMSEQFPQGKVGHGMRIIELASGENFLGVDGVEKLPALPERRFPKSAGRAYFEAVKSFLTESAL